MTTFAAMTGTTRSTAGSGTDIATYAGAATIVQNGGGWTVTDAGGTDSLTNIEVVDDSASGVTRLVGNNGYPTIQAAIDASSNGDVIVIASGTYVGNVNVNKDVTILGPNHGISGTATRGAEAIIDGQITISVAGVTIDGVEIVGDALGSLGDTGVEVFGNNFVLTNSVLDGTGDTAIVHQRSDRSRRLEQPDHRLFDRRLHLRRRDRVDPRQPLPGRRRPRHGPGQRRQFRERSGRHRRQRLRRHLFGFSEHLSVRAGQRRPERHINGNTITNSGAARPVQIRRPTSPTTSSAPTSTRRSTVKRRR